MQLDELVKYLDEYLALKDIKDYPNAANGLQVEGKDEVRRIVTAVDASVASTKAAAERKADALIVHHGVLWSGLKPITGPLRARLASLVKNDISLYSAHLPLDAHPEIGNNVMLAKLLGLAVDGRFGDYNGTKIGVSAACNLSLDELVSKVEKGLNVTVKIVPSGGGTVRRVGIVSGGGADSIAEAFEEEIDTLITGECSHQEYLEAEELGVNVISAGHYATETLGVAALGEHLAKKFNLEHSFFSYPTGL